MSTWRRKALALFPELKGSLNDPDCEPFSVFVDPVPLAITAHLEDDRDTLRRVHGYAEWALRQGGKLWQVAAIGFYEDLLRIVGGVPWERIVPWLSPYAVAEIRKTWALGIQGEDLPKLERLVESRREQPYQTHVYSTGEIQDL